MIELLDPSKLQVNGLVDWVVARLSERRTLQGLRVLPDYAGDLFNKLERDLAAFGISAVCEPADDTNASAHASSLHSSAAFDVIIGENVWNNRNRTLANPAAVIADDAARRAMTGLLPGQRVRQTGDSQDFLIKGAWDYFVFQQRDDNGITQPLDPSQPENWAPVWNIYQLAELVKRSLHLDCPSPDGGMTECVWKSTTVDKVFPKKDVLTEQDLRARATLHFEASIDFRHMTII